MRTIGKEELAKILADHKEWSASGGERGSRADLSRADLSDADLSRADLSRADLSDADLSGADLSGAYLSGAYLSRADLSGAYLSRANLSGADLSGAYLSGAYLSRADLSDAVNVPPLLAASETTAPRAPGEAPDYDARAARYREAHPEVPFVPQLDAKILDVVTSEKGVLDMGAWHTCATTHCRAGWAITLAGPAGKKLEDERGPERAGAMIYRASTGRVPYFFATDEDALADIKACAARQVTP